jgi:hypothetical protein
MGEAQPCPRCGAPEMSHVITEGIVRDSDGNLYRDVQFCLMVSCSGMLYGVRADSSLVEVEVVEAEYRDVDG